MSAMTKIKMTGERSIESKLQRLAYDLEWTANRIKQDHGEKYERIAESVRSISSQLGKIARGLEP